MRYTPAHLIEQVHMFSPLFYKEIYKKQDSSSWHYSAIVVEINKLQIVLEADYAGFINYWNLFSGELIKTVIISGCRGIFVWNETYAYISGQDCIIVLDIINQKLVITVAAKVENSSFFFTMVKFDHPKFGECLLCGTGRGDNKVYLFKCPK